MIKLNIVKKTNLSIFSKWFVIINLILSVTTIIFDLHNYIQLLIILITIPFLAILKFGNNFQIIGNIVFEKDNFQTKINSQINQYNYDKIEKVKINNYSGQRQKIISTLNIYPYNDGLDNYITLKDGQKFEVLIKNQTSYENIKKHISSIRPNNKITS